MTRIFLLTLFFLVILSSCSIQKRTYNRGFAINWHINKGNSAEKLKPKHPNFSKQNEEIKRNTIENEVIRLEDTIQTFRNRASEETNKFADSTLCDLIILISGEEVFGKVTHVEHDVIKYKKCDNPDGPTYSIAKNTVFIIKYSNGTKDIFNVIEDKANDNMNPPTTKTNIEEENDKEEYFGAASSALILFSIVLLYFKIGLPIIIITIFTSFILGIIGIVESQSSLAIFGTVFSLLMGFLLLYLEDII